MEGERYHFVDKRRDHFHFNADSGLYSIKKPEGNEEIVWNGQHLRKEQVVCKMEANLASLQYLTSGLERNDSFVTA